MRGLTRKVLLSSALLFVLLLFFLYIFSPKIITISTKYLTGYTVAFDEIRALEGYIRGFKILGSNFVVESAHINIPHPILGILRNDFDEIKFVNPSIYITSLSEKDKDFNFIKNLPSVKKLIIERGSVNLSDKESEYETVLSSMKLTLKDYSPARGGMMDFEMLFRIRNKFNESAILLGSIKGNSRIRPFVDGNLSMEGSFKLSVDNLEAGFVGLVASNLAGNFVYEAGRFFINGLSADITDFSLRIGQKPLVLGGLNVNADVLFDTTTQALQFNNISALMKPFGKVTGMIDIKVDKNYPYLCELSIQEADIKETLRLMKPILSEALTHWSLSGRASMKTRLVGSINDGEFNLQGSASITLAEGAFSYEDGLKAGQGISGSLLVDLKYPQDIKKKTSLSIEIASKISKGEYLWDRFYLNQADRALNAKATLSLETKEDNNSEIIIETDLFSTGAYKLLISVDKHNSLYMKAALSDIELKALNSALLIESLPSIYPLARNMDIAGRLNINIDTLRSEKGYSLWGAIDVKGLSLWLPSVEMGIKEVNTNLPIYISDADGVNKHGKEDVKKGFLSFESVQIKNIELKDVYLPLRIEKNLLLLWEPLTVDFLGGKLTIEAIEAGLSIREPMWLKTSFRLADAMVAPITEALGFGYFSGRLNSYISDVKLKGKTLSTEGYIAIDIFSGKVLISRIHGEAPFNYFGADIDFSGIDLEKLTETIKIGRITGIIKGSINGLEVQYGQAASFVMDIESVPVEDIKQTVSTDAVENISILGTGSEGISRVLSTGINQFFKEFPYKKLGIRCVLENDVFTIRGKIFEGGKEYIIRRGLFRGIDVINHNPNNTISFKDMQSRLASIFQQRAREERNTKEKEAYK